MCADSGFIRLLRVHNIVDRVRGFVHVSLQFIDGCFARSASRFHRVLECRECVGHVVEVCRDISQLAIGVHDASSLKSVEALIDTMRCAISCRFCSEASVPSLAMRPEAQECVRFLHDPRVHAWVRARLRPLRCRNLMSPTNDHRAGHDTDVELRRRRQVATRTSPGSGSVEGG